MTIPWNVQYHNALQTGQRYPLAVAFKLYPLFEVLVGLLEPLFAAQYSVPHVVLRPGPALFRVFLPLMVEIEGDLCVYSNAEVVVHHASLEEALQ